MNSFKFVVPQTSQGQRPEGDGEILGKHFSFRHTKLAANEPFEIEIRSKNLGRNDAFNAALLLSSALCLIKLQSSVGLHPVNVQKTPGSDQFHYIASCSGEPTSQVTRNARNDCR